MKMKTHLIIFIVIIIVGFSCSLIYKALVERSKDFTIFNPVVINNTDETYSITDALQTNHSDGSFTVKYIWKLYYYGKIKEDGNCNFTYPNGWAVATYEEYNNFSKYPGTYGNKSGKNVDGYALTYKKPLGNSSNTEHLKFHLLPPEVESSNLEPQYREYLKWIDKYGTSNGERIINVTFKKDKDWNMVDLITLDNSSDDLIVVHSVDKAFPNKFGANFFYYGPYGQDQDVYSIIDSITCEGYQKIW